MTRDAALLLSALRPIAGRLAVALLLATMLVAVLLSALLPMLSEPELSPTRWYTFAT
jgi:hypothetical protein